LGWALLPPLCAPPVGTLAQADAGCAVERGRRGRMGEARRPRGINNEAGAGGARLTPARPLWGGGLCCVGRRVTGEEKGRGGLPTWCGVGAQFVARTRAHPAPLGRPAARTADRAKGCRVLSGTRQPSFFSREPRESYALHVVRFPGFQYTDATVNWKGGALQIRQVVISPMFTSEGT
jgi:hypothetical protein